MNNLLSNGRSAFKNNYLAPKRIDLFNEISKDIDSAFNEIFGSKYFTGLKQHKGYPLMDAVRTKEALILHYTVPGVNKNSISAEITEDELGKLLTVSGQLGQDYVYEENNYQIRELSKQEFRRVIRLPEDVTDDDAKVCLENGILTLTFKLQKQEEIKPKVKKLSIN
jgi:HSP20 family molecular chaperone IbpA